MALILSIDTSTEVGSAALHEGDSLKIYHENFIEKSHSEFLVKTIKDILTEAEISADELDAVAVSKGPGSYTGLRIGVSIAKGICYGSNVKLISVETLTAMALEVGSLNILEGCFCPMIDARRMEVYCQVFDKQLRPKGEVESKIIEEDSFREYLDEQKMYFFGNGSGKCKGVLKSKNSSFVDGIYPKAKYIGQLALKKYNTGSFENLAYFEPYYLKEFMTKKPSKKI